MIPSASQTAERLLFPGTPASTAVRYLFAIACCVLAFLLRLALDPVLQEHSPLLIFELAVAVSAIRGGIGPGVLATVAGAIASLHFFPSSGGTFFAVVPEYRATVLSQLLVFLLVGALLSWLSGDLRRLRWRALDLASQRNEILESITDGFEALDSSYRFVYLNRVAGDLVGRPRDELIGKSIWDALPEIRGTTVERRFREVVERHAAAHFESQMAFSGRWFEFHAHPGRHGGVSVYFRDITERKQAELNLRRTQGERDAALQNVRVLSGLLPICASCKKIRDEAGAWQQMESYISRHSQAQFSHGLCPECAARYHEELERETWHGG